MAGTEVIRELVNVLGLEVDTASAAKAEAVMKGWADSAEKLGNVVAVASGKLADFINQTGDVAAGIRKIGRALEKTGPGMAQFTVQAMGATKAMAEQAKVGSSLREGVADIGRETWLAAKKTSALGTGLTDMSLGLRDVKRAEAEATKATKEGIAARSTSLAKAEDGVTTFAKLGLAIQGVREVYGLLAGAAHFLVGGLTESSREMQQAAKVSGVTTQFFQEMAYAAQTVRFQTDDLRDVFVDLSDKISNGGEDQKKAFKKLGVQLKDTTTGKLRPMEAIVLDLADGFQRMEDGTQKTAYASTLLGEQGSRLLPVLSKGSAGLKAWAKEAGQLGAVLDEETLKASADFDRQMGRLSATATGLRNVLGSALLPALTKLADALLHVMRRLAPVLKAKTKEWAQALAKATDWLTTGVDKLRLALTLTAGVLLGKYLMAVTTVTGAQLAWGSAALIAGARAAAGAALAVGPWLLVGAVIALAVDELYGFATGADSALGDFIDWLGKVDPEENNLTRMLKRAGSLLFDLTDKSKWQTLQDAMLEHYKGIAMGAIRFFAKLPGWIATALVEGTKGLGKLFTWQAPTTGAGPAGFSEEQRRQLNADADAALLRRKYNPRGGLFSGSMQTPEDAAIERARMYGSRDWVGRYGIGVPSGPDAPAAYFGRGASATTALPAMSRAGGGGVFAPQTTIEMTVQAAPGMSTEALGTAAVDRAYDRAEQSKREALALFSED